MANNIIGIVKNNFNPTIFRMHSPFPRSPVHRMAAYFAVFRGFLYFTFFLLKNPGLMPIRIRQSENSLKPYLLATEARRFHGIAAHLVPPA
jgi:hypothetical protein